MIVKNIFIEITSNCNAACYDCVRQMPGSNVPKNEHLSIKVFKQLIDDIKDTLELVNFEGTYSDAPMHQNFLEYVEYIVKNTNAKILINTNGSNRNVDFWSKLGSLFKNNSKGRIYKVAFGIDGIDQESHTKYRVDTYFDKIMENAQAYINAGGCAIWKMLPFDFNKELEGDAKKMAKNLGFWEFRRNKTTRYFDKAHRYIIAKRWHEYYGNDIEKIEYEYGLGIEGDRKKFFDIVNAMEPHIEFEPDPRFSLKNNIDEAYGYIDIPKCKWKDVGQIQIGFNGVVWQCCHMQSAVQEFRFDKTWEQFDRWKKHYSYQENWNNLNYHRIYDILNHRYFTKDLDESLKNNFTSKTNARMAVCARKCGDYGIPNKQI